MPWILARTRGGIYVGAHDTLTACRAAARPFSSKKAAITYLREAGAEDFHGAYLPEFVAAQPSAEANSDDSA